MRWSSFLAEKSDRQYLHSGVIYMIVIGDRYYIGSTNKLSRRIKAHVEMLERGTHPNVIMSRSFNRNCSLSVYVVEVLPDDCDKKTQTHIEQHYLDMVIGDPRCMNVRKHADFGGCTKTRPVIVNGKRYESITEAANEFGMVLTKLRNWLTGREPVPLKYGIHELRYETGDEGKAYWNPKLVNVVVDGVSMTRKEAAALCGVSTARIGDWINGSHAIPEKIGIKSIHVEGKPDVSHVGTRVRPVVINGVRYESCVAACEVLNVVPQTMLSWLKGRLKPSPKRNIHSLHYA